MEEQEGCGPIEVAGKGDQSKLAALHGVIAEFLTLTIASGKASPAYVMAGIAFLKNNNITADPATNAALAGLAETLQKRRAKGGGLTRAAMDEATGHFDAILGGMGTMQ